MANVAHNGHHAPKLVNPAIAESIAEVLRELASARKRADAYRDIVVALIPILHDQDRQIRAQAQTITQLTAYAVEYRSVRARIEARRTAA